MITSQVVACQALGLALRATAYCMRAVRCHVPPDADDWACTRTFCTWGLSSA